MDDLIPQLLEMIREKDAEIKRLTDVILIAKGLIPPPDTTVHVESGVDKVRVGGNVPWPILKQQLEQSHKVDWAAKAAEVDHELLDLADVKIKNEVQENA